MVYLGLTNHGWCIYLSLSLSLLSTRPQNVPESDLPLDFHNLTNQASPLCAQPVILCQPIIFFGFHSNAVSWRSPPHSTSAMSRVCCHLKGRDAEKVPQKHFKCDLWQNPLINDDKYVSHIEMVEYLGCSEWREIGGGYLLRSALSWF